MLPGSIANVLIELQVAAELGRRAVADPGLGAGDRVAQRLAVGDHRSGGGRGPTASSAAVTSDQRQRARRSRARHRGQVGAHPAQQQHRAAARAARTPSRFSTQPSSAAATSVCASPAGGS